MPELNRYVTPRHAEEITLAIGDSAISILTRVEVEDDPTLNQCSKAINARLTRMCHRYGISEEITFCITRGLFLNALAGPLQNDRYFIAIDLTTIDALLSLCMQLCKTEEVARLLDLSGASGSVRPAGARVDFADGIHSILTVNGQPKLSDERMAQAFFVFESALCFVLYHEFVHIKNGHVAFLNSRYDLGFILEVSEYSEAIDSLTWQTLEMDADSVAISLCLQDAFLYYKFSNESHRGKWPAEFRNYLLCQLFGAYCVFNLFFYSEAIAGHGGAVSCDNRTHPEPLNRLMIVVGVIERNLEYYELEAIKANYSDGYVKPVAEAFYNGVFRLANVKEIELDRATFEASHAKLFIDLLARWARIRPQLLPFLLGGSLAPPSVEPR